MESEFSEIQSNFNLEKATKAVLTLKQKLGKGIIALGQWIALVKDSEVSSMSFKEWEDWLRRDVGISRRSADRYMKVASRIDYPTLERIGPAKIYEILDAPEEKQEELLTGASARTSPQLRDDVKRIKNSQKDIYPELEPEVKGYMSDLMTTLEKVNGYNYGKLTQNWKDYVASRMKLVIRLCEEVLGKLGYLSQ